MRDGQGPAQPLSLDDEEILFPSRDRRGVGLNESADNLASVISQFSISRRVRLAKYLGRFYEGAEDILTPFYDGKVWVSIEERGGRQIPAAPIVRRNATLPVVCLRFCWTRPHHH